MSIDEAYKLADALYDAGYNAMRKGKDYDPRGTDEWQAVVDSLLKQNGQQIEQQPVSVDELLAARLVDELDGLVSESDGVSGLHLNGDVATWDELLPGGRFERLSSLDELRELLATQQQPEIGHDN